MSLSSALSQDILATRYTFLPNQANICELGRTKTFLIVNSNIATYQNKHLVDRFILFE